MSQSRIGAANRHFNSLRTVEAQLPYCFSNGARVEGLTAACPGCGEDYDSAHLRGLVCEVEPDVIEAKMVGYCPRCSSLNTHGMRLIKEPGIFIAEAGTHGFKIEALEPSCDNLVRVREAVHRRLN